MNNELSKALEMLYDMEKNNYYMTRSIEKLDVEIQSLGIRKNIVAPQKRYSTSDDAGGVIAVVALFISIVIAVICGCSFDSFWVGVLVFFFSLIAISFLGVFLMTIFEDREAEYVYEKEYEVFSEKLRNDNIRVDKENREKSFLIQQRNLLNDRKSEATEKLNGFYDLFGIADEFRNIIPVGYMYEFARLGVSTKLEGVDGLYYLVHKELRADCFQLSLDEISRKLDTIIDNQRNISVELKLLNDKCDTIIEHTKKEAEQSARNNELLNKAVENTEIAKYNSERIAKELEYQTFIELWDINGSYLS